jgi:hypothetical protein
MARRKAGNGGEGDTTVGITKDARDALVAYLATLHNPTMRDVLSALVKRFLALPPPVRTVVLNTVDEGMEPQYAAVLEEMARELRAKGEKSTPPGNPGGAKSRVKLPGAVRTATGVEFREPKGT